MTKVYTVFDDVILACAEAALTMPSHGPQGKLKVSTPACGKSGRTRKECAICRSPRQLETCSLVMDS